MKRTALLAATILGAFFAAPDAGAQPVTGLYIGAGVGANFEQAERTKSVNTLASPLGSNYLTSANTKLDRNVGGATFASVGYGLGNGVRFEIEGDYSYNRTSHGHNNNTIISDGGREQKYGPMVNVLFDLDIGIPYVFPYIGAGAGYQWEDRRRTTSYGSFVVPGPYGSGRSLTLTNATAFGSGVDSSFAYQGIVGLSFPVPYAPGLSLTTEYRFLGLEGQRTFGQTIVSGGTVVSRRVNATENYNHSLMLGVRYAFNVAPPPAATVVPVPLTPAVQTTYLVFFDWDRADLTDRARQIIAEAARATTRTQVTRIELTGNTDTTGTAGYNQGLSVRRAQNVASELVRLGVPRAAITTRGVGFSNPLVATGPGVREPQNRRVEIVLR